MTSTRHRRLFLLTLILLFGALTRLLYIDAQSIWVDEGYAVYHANYPSLVETLSRDTHPPLYFAGLRLWQEIAGPSTFALRYFSLLPSLLSMAMIYLLSKELLRARGDQTRFSVVPMLAVFLLAIADSEIFLAQELRHYTWHTLLGISSMWAFVRWIRTQARRDWLLWVGFTTALAYTHYIGTFTGIVQGLYVLIFLRGRVRVTALGALITSALLLSPWLLVVGPDQIDNQGINWSVDLFAPGVIDDIRTKYLTQQWPLMGGLALLGIVTLITNGQTRIRWRPIGPKWLPLLWAVVPFALTIIINEFLPFLQPRRLSMLTPAIVLLVAFGLGNLRGPARTLLVMVLLVYGITTVDFYRPKPPWREVSAIAATYASAGDVVLTDIEGGDYQLQYYYGQRLRDGIDYGSLKTQRDFFPETYEAWLPGIIDPHNTVWFFYWHSHNTSGFDWLRTLNFIETARIIVKHDIGGGEQIDLTTYRFDRLPETDVDRYENGLILREAIFYADDLRVDLLWDISQPLTETLVTSAKLLDANETLVAQEDYAPFMPRQIAESPEQWWLPGEKAVYDPKRLQPRADLATIPPGDYTLIVQVYRADDQQSIPTTNGDPWAIIDTVTLTGE